MNPIKIAIVGSETTAQKKLLPVLAGNEIRKRIEVTAVCDVVPGKAVELCQKYQFDHAFAFRDYEAMLQVADIDVVAIFTPIPLHFKQARAALENGKHVYIENLLSNYSHEALELSYLAKEKGLILQSSLGQILDPYHQQTKRTIESGEIRTLSFVNCGELEMKIDTDHSNGKMFNDYYKAMLSTLFYPMTFVTGILGPVKQVSIFKETLFQENDQVGSGVSILLDFGNGVFTTIKGNESEEKLEFIGTKGKLEVDHEMSRYPGVNGIQYIVNCINEKSHLQLGCDQGTHVIEIIEKIYESIRSGLVQKVETTFKGYSFIEEYGREVVAQLN